MKFDLLVGNTATQISRPPVEPHKVSDIFGSWGEEYFRVIADSVCLAQKM